MSDVLEMRYLGYEVERNQTICTWEIELPRGFIWSDLENLKEWCTSNVKLGKYVGIWFKRNNKGEFPPKYHLNIRGIGQDGRCSFCKSFRTGLNTKAEKKGLSFEQDGACSFE